MQIIDTHTHLYLEAFDVDQNEVINRAIDAGVSHFFIPAIDSNYTGRMYALEKSYPNLVSLMAGLHPYYVKDNVEEELEKVFEQLNTRSFCAIGEIGIDLHWDKTYLKEQQKAFSRQIELAKEYELPIVIHCRDAFDDIYDILIKNKSDKLRGILHCFTGSLDDAKKIIDINFKIGIGGVVTFKNGGIDKFLDQIDISYIVLETDSPYLSPTPHRGKRNESSYITYVIDKLSDIYGLSNSDIISQTSLNANDVFDFNN